MAERIALSCDQWIDVRERLKVKDKRDVHSYSVDGLATDGLTYRLNVVKHQIATAAVRITDWHLSGEKSYPTVSQFKDKVAAIEELGEDIFDEITAALGNSDKAKQAAEDEEKNAIAGGESV